VISAINQVQQNQRASVSSGDILRRMNKLEMYGYVACGVGAAALITGLLPRDKMDKVRAFLHQRFGPKGAKVDDPATVRMQLIIFGAFLLFVGLVLSGINKR
jgi:hypothetical protein